jgi:hypothetical protein
LIGDLVWRQSPAGPRLCKNFRAVSHAITHPLAMSVDL